VRERGARARQAFTKIHCFLFSPARLVAHGQHSRVIKSTPPGWGVHRYVAAAINSEIDVGTKSTAFQACLAAFIFLVFGLAAEPRS
jgi:hypothetical protein